MVLSFCLIINVFLFSNNSKYFESFFIFKIKAVVLKSALTRALLYKGEVKNSFLTRFLSSSFVSRESTPETKSDIGLIGD